MTLPPPIYDLVLLIDPALEEPARAKIVADARASIEAQGELIRHDPWGERALAYPIARKTSAEYHLLQFHAPAPQLLDSLEHSLRIIDGILRFRIIKLKPGVPEAPDMRVASAAPRRSEGESQPPPAPEPVAEGQQDAAAQLQPSAAEPAGEVEAEAGDRA
jgi:small subunit ribosomal protein S6